MSEFATETNPYGSFMTEPAVPEGTSARAGAKLVEGQQKAPDEAIVEALRTVHDPEIPVNIYDLGLIYDTERLEDGDVRILMTLTAPACPVAGEMPGWVSDAVKPIPGLKSVHVEIVWEPQWGMEMMSDEARLELGFM